MGADTKETKQAFHPLTDARCRALRYGEKPIFDGQGLYLEAMKSRTVWRFKAKLKGGKPILMTLGMYPSMTLAMARNMRGELRELIASGKDPRKVIEQRENAEHERLANTFESVTKEWLQVRSDKVTKQTNKDTAVVISRHVFPMIGKKPIADITPQDVMQVLRDVEKKSTYLPYRIKSLLARVFSYAIQTGKGNSNPAAAIVSRDVLKSHRTEHYKTISIDELPRLIAAIDADNAGIQVKSAIRLLMMLFMRKNELRMAEWSHIDLNAALWTIPADNTKKGRGQVYPLPRQAVEILRELHIYTGEFKYVFGTRLRKNDVPLGHTTINSIITRIGFHKKMTVHGFRALAASWMDEQGYNRLAIERQLSHLEQGQTNQAYHRADYMQERREMLQAWADYLDSLNADTTDKGKTLQTVEKAA